MKVDLTDYERGLDSDDYAERLEALQDRLERLQAAHIGTRARTMIVFEGWDAAGKGGIIRALCGRWDPRWFEVHPIGAPTPPEKERHFLYRFWTRLPGAGEIAVFDRSWYGRVAVERVESFASEPQWRAAYDEINAFEAQQHADGVRIIKLFAHVTQEEQDRRLAARLDDPWKRWKTGADDYRNRARRADYLKAYAEMFERTDTRSGRWKIIDANRKKGARLAALAYIADQMESWLDLTPPDLDPAVVALAEAAFGYKPGEGGED